MTDQPPQDLIAEQATLGAMMISAQAIGDVIEVVRPEDYYRPAHTAIHQAIVDLYSGGEDVDAVTVANELLKRGQLVHIGGGDYLLKLIQMVPTAVSAASYGRIVVDKAKRRRLVEFGIRCQQLGSTDSEDVEALVAQAEVFLREIHRPGESALAFSDLMAEWNTWAESGAEDDVIETPWVKVNEILGGGLNKGRLYVCGGRPGQGKSISGLNIAAHAAEQGRNVMVFSLEMPRTEVASRLLAAGAQVSFQQVIRRQMKQDTANRIHEYMSTHEGMNLHCVDKAGLTIEQIVGYCRSIKNLDLVFLDYAQLVSPSDRRVKRHEQVAHVSRTLKILAKDLGIAVVLAAQLNRQLVDPRTGKSRIPTLADLSESGALEQDSDAVLLLHRPETEDGTVDVVVAKNRSGLTGVVGLAFVGQQARLG